MRKTIVLTALTLAVTTTSAVAGPLDRLEDRADFIESRLERTVDRPGRATWRRPPRRFESVLEPQRHRPHPADRPVERGLDPLAVLERAKAE
jgi:hypothetical protein